MDTEGLSQSLVDIEGKPYDLTGIKAEFNAKNYYPYEGEAKTTLTRG